MDDNRFNDLGEVFSRLYPAFNTKVNDFKNSGYLCSEIDIWNYLKDTKWSLDKKLCLYDMVNDIMKVEVIKIIEYIKNKE